MPSQLRLVRLGGESFSLDIPLHRTPFRKLMSVYKLPEYPPRSVASGGASGAVDCIEVGARECVQRIREHRGEGGEKKSAKEQSHKKEVPG
jgi:hypothetical protein